MKRFKRQNKSSEDYWLWAYADLITNLLIFFVAMLSVSEMSSVKWQEVSEKLSGKRTASSLRAIEATLNQDIKDKGLSPVVKTELTKDGLELSFDAKIMFSSDSQVIEEKWRPIFHSVIESIKPYKDLYRFAIEGHSDSVAIGHKSAFKSNWELSAARAASVREELEKASFDPARTRIEAYAHTKPLPKETLKNLSPKEAYAKLRRVVIRLY